MKEHMRNSNPIEPHLKHIQLKKSLNDALVRGDLKPGDKLPSQDEIADEYKVSLGTVREAITSLVHEGLLLRIQGKGTFVADFKKKPVTIALVIPRLYGDTLPGYGAGTEITPLLTQAVESAARKMGANILLYMYHDDIDIERENLRNILERQPDGMIIIHLGGSSNTDYLMQIQETGTHVLLMDTHLPEMDLDYIVSDNVKGAKTAVKTLIENGYSDIVLITRERDVSSLNEREAGYTEIMDESYLEKNILYINDEIESELNAEQAAYILALDLLKTHDFPFAIFTSDAPIMAGVLHALDSINIEPNSLALACFDETNIKPPDGILFINIIQQLHSIGIKGVDIMMKRLSGIDGTLSDIVETQMRITDNRLK